MFLSKSPFVSFQENGVKSLFLELSGCAFSCKNCEMDTVNNYPFSNKDFESITNNIKNVVFIGGEPLLQQYHIANLMLQYPNINYVIETKGVRQPKFPILSKAKYIVYPKIIKDNNDNIISNPIFFLYAKEMNYEVRFLVRSIKEVDELTEFIKRFKINPDKIYIYPNVKSKKDLKKFIDKNYFEFTLLDYCFISNPRNVILPNE